MNAGKVLLGVVAGIAAGALVHPAAYWLAAFIGAGLVYAGLSNSCGMTVVLAKMPWNKISTCNSASCCTPETK